MKKLFLLLLFPLTAYAGTSPVPPDWDPTCGKPVSVDVYDAIAGDTNLMEANNRTTGRVMRRSDPEGFNVSVKKDGNYTLTMPEGVDRAKFKYAGKNVCGRGDSATVYVGEWGVSDPNEPDEPIPDPNDIFVPPVDPNDPPPPVVDPNATMGNYPIPELTYEPDFNLQKDVFGDYIFSEPGYCKNIHTDESPTVTLMHGERLFDAVQRLRAISPDGGVVRVRGDIAMEQCDSLKITDKHYMKDGLTLRGINDAEGNRPRMYCRSAEPKAMLNGTIPTDEVVATAITIGGGELVTNVVIDNIHVDGYKSALKMPSNGRFVVMNSWFHGGRQNGISNGNTGHGKDAAYFASLRNHSRFSFEICGSEISHYGQGNHTHNFYMHRALGGGGDNPFLRAMGLYDTWSKVTLVDVKCHSAGWASCFKSIANENNVYNSEFLTTEETDPSFITKHGQMLIDVPACSDNDIVGNLLVTKRITIHKADGGTTKTGNAPIGLRGRRTAMRGCDGPMLYTPYSKYNGPEGPVMLDPNHPAHTEQYWTDIKASGVTPFPSNIENNIFVITGEERFMSGTFAIHAYGTRLLYEGPKKVGCLLPVPETWVDLSFATIENNTFIGFSPDKLVDEIAREHHINCWNAEPSVPASTGNYSLEGNVVQ